MPRRMRDEKTCLPPGGNGDEDGEAGVRAQYVQA